MNLFPEEFSDIGRRSGLGENVQSPRPEDWGGNLIADVFAWFQTTPGANPNPSVEALYYYAGSTYDQFIKDVSAVRAANPDVAAQIDAERRAAGLDAPVTPPPPPPPPVVVQPPVAPPPRPVVVQPPIVSPPRPVFQGPIYSASSGTANATMIGYLSDDPSKAEFTVTAGSQVPDNFVLVRALPAPVVTPPRPVFPNPSQALQPIYTKQYPLPTINRAAKGFLVGYGPDDAPITQPFDLKAGDPIPANWQEDYAFSTQPVTVLPTTPAPVTPTPTQPGAAAGIAPLLLAAAAAYFLGS